MVEFLVSNLLIFLIAFGIIGFIAIFSVVGLFLLMKKMWFITDQITILLELIEEFKSHLEDLNRADKLFGEPKSESYYYNFNKKLLNSKVNWDKFE